MVNFKNASFIIDLIAPESAEGWRFCAFVRANAEDFAAAQRAMAYIPDEESGIDLELLEAMAIAAAKSGNRAESWKYYRRIQHLDPTADAIDRLEDPGLFDFASEWFGYGPRSLLDYSKGIGSGSPGWTADTSQGLRQLVRHPIDTITSLTKGIAEICSPENLKLLLSTRELASALGEVAGFDRGMMLL